MPVVHCKKAKYDVYIGRPSKWGNPYPLTKKNTRTEVIGKFAIWLEHQIQIGSITLEELAALDGKTLGCWCSPHPCHGDVLETRAKQAKKELNR